MADSPLDLMAWFHSFNADIMFWQSAVFHSSRGLLLLVLLGWAAPARAVVLWNNSNTILTRETGEGLDILGGAVKRDESANDTLYFKFRVNPLSEKDTEEYFAGFELYEGDVERLGLGKAWQASAYSAYFHAGTSPGSDPYIDLHSTKGEPSAGTTGAGIQYPRRGSAMNIVLKVQYVPGEDDLVTVWLNPDLGPGATEVYQSEGLTTRFTADARFDSIRLRHGGQGPGWTFSDMAVATSFSDFVDMSSATLNEASSDAAAGRVSFSFWPWQKKDGFSQRRIMALAQMRNGYLVVGGDDGLARFDGVRFESLGVAEGLNVGPVRTLFSDSAGALWISGADGVLDRWDNRKLTSFTSRDGLPPGAITALAEDESGRIWIGTESGVASWKDGKISSLPKEYALQRGPVSFLYRDRHGTMWAGIKNAGVFKSLNGRMVPLPGPGDGLLGDSHCLLVDEAGRTWISAGDNSIFCLEAGNWQRYRISPNEAKTPVTTLAEGAAGTVWAGAASGGLFRFKDGKLASVKASSGLVGNQMGSLFIDREGNLWAGTDAGLNRLQLKSLSAFGQNEGLGVGAVQGLGEVAPGIVWAAKTNGGIFRWNGGNFIWLTSAHPLPRDSRASVILVTRDGYCWGATADSLLFYKDPIAAADEVEVIKDAPQGIISLAEDQSGGLWTGTSDGQILQLYEGKWRAPTGFSQTNAVTSLVPGKDASMWAGTDGNGLFQFKNGSALRIGEGQLPGAIRTLYIDAQGSVWIGTANRGLLRWRDGSMASFTTQEGLTEKKISQVLEDDSGRLWLGGDSGIACVRKDTLDDLAKGRIPAVSPVVFSRKDGMLSEECMGGFSPAGLKTKNGLLWFPTRKGVVVVDPRMVRTPASPPDAVIEEVLVDGAPHAILDLASTFRINPGRHRVEIQYTGLSFEAPDQIHFRYRLEGLDSDWLDAGLRRTAFYNYLPPGDYRFHVSARNGDGRWSDDGVGLGLVVQRHFWLTWWFMGFSGIGLLISVAGSVRFVEKRKLHRRLRLLEQERALERERTRIAQDLHDEMGAKLCRISFLSEHARRGGLIAAELQDQISSISTASREVLHSLDEIVWAVNPQNDSLENVASYIGQYAQEYFQGTGTDCELDMPARLPPHPLSSHTRHQLFLAVQEAITNTLKHAGAKQVRISLAVAGGAIEITVTDNGRGFDPKAGASSGDGLENMRLRMADIGGKCAIESVAGRGTKVHFKIPLNSSRKNV